MSISNIPELEIIKDGTTHFVEIAEVDFDYNPAWGRTLISAKDARGNEWYDWLTYQQIDSIVENYERE